MWTNENVVIYDTYKRAVWVSETSMKGANSHVLTMQDGGNLIVDDGNGKPT